MLFMLLIMV